MDAAKEQQGIAYRQALMTRLIQLWMANTPFPGKEDQLLTKAVVQRLCRYIVVEGHGR
jgi:hypothetical protein